MKQKQLGFCIAAILSAHGVIRQAHAAEAESYTQLDEVVVVASKIATPYAQVAASVSVVGSVDIEQLAAADFRDVANSLPGISLRRDATRFGLDTISVRGIGGNRVLVLIDGVPVNKGFSVGAYSDSGRPLTDLDNVRRIEILRGPASALYGSDAIGGVVSIATFDPKDLLRDATGNFAARVRTGFDSRDDELRAGFDVATAFGALQTQLSYTHRKHDELDTTGKLAPNPQEGTSDSVNAKLVWEDAPLGRMRFLANGVRTRAQTAVNSLLGTPPRFTNTVSLQGDDTSETLRAAIDQSLAINTWLATGGEWRVYWSQTDALQLSDEQRGPAPTRTRIERSFNLFASQLGAELTLNRSITLGALEQRWVYGVESLRTHVHDLRDGLQTNLNSGATTNNILGEVMPVRDFPTSHLLEVGAYVQTDLRMGEHWSVIPAVRFDYYDLTPKPDSIFTQDNPSTTTTGITTHSWTPKLGVVYTFGGASLFAQYAQGFRAPPIEDANIGFDLPTLNYRAIPNPDLKPEKIHGYELGARIDSGAQRASVSIFYNDYQNFIESRVNLGVEPLSGTTIFQSRNAAKARIYGIEVQAQFDLDHIADSLRGLRIDLLSTWGRGDDRVRDQPLNNVEPAMARLKLSYTAPSRVWSSDVAVTVVDAKTHVADPPTGAALARTAGYTTVDGYFHLTLSERIKIDIALLNLLDRHYQVWSDVRGRAYNDTQLPLYYQPGRSASLSVKWQL